MKINKAKYDAAKQKEAFLSSTFEPANGPEMRKFVFKVQAKYKVDFDCLIAGVGSELATALTYLAAKFFVGLPCSLQKHIKRIELRPDFMCVTDATIGETGQFYASLVLRRIVQALAKSLDIESVLMTDPQFSVELTGTESQFPPLDPVSNTRKVIIPKSSGKTPATGGTIFEITIDGIKFHTQKKFMSSEELKAAYFKAAQNVMADDDEDDEGFTEKDSDKLAIYCVGLQKNGKDLVIQPNQSIQIRSGLVFRIQWATGRDESTDLI